MYLAVGLTSLNPLSDSPASADMSLIWDKKFRKYVDLYAEDQDKFFEDFAVVRWQAGLGGKGLQGHALVGMLSVGRYSHERRHWGGGGSRC